MELSDITEGFIPSVFSAKETPHKRGLCGDELEEHVIAGEAMICW